MRNRVTTVMLFLGCLVFPDSPAASGRPLPSLEQGRALVVPQSFYPPGYLELKIAAAMTERLDGLQAPFPVRKGRQFGSDEPPMRHIEILDCVLPDSSADTPREWVLEISARRVAEIQQTLPLYRYRREIYEEPVLSYERQMIALAGGVPPRPFKDGHFVTHKDGYDLIQRVFDTERGLIREIDGRRYALQRRRPAIRYTGGCGAGGPDSIYIIRTMPENGSVWMTPAFRFFYCQSKTIEPWDVQSCRGWRQYHPDEESYPLGRHMFQILWPDGAITRGDRTFAPLRESQGAVTVTLRRN